MPVSKSGRMRPRAPFSKAKQSKAVRAACCCVPPPCRPPLSLDAQPPCSFGMDFPWGLPGTRVGHAPSVTPSRPPVSGGRARWRWLCGQFEGVTERRLGAAEREERWTQPPGRSKTMREPFHTPPRRAGGVNPAIVESMGASGRGPRGRLAGAARRTAVRPPPS